MLLSSQERAVLLPGYGSTHRARSGSYGNRGAILRGVARAPGPVCMQRLDGGPDARDLRKNMGHDDIGSTELEPSGIRPGVSGWAPSHGKCHGGDGAGDGSELP